MMNDATDGVATLQKIASDGAEDYIDIPADGTGASANYLAEQLINNVITPGATEAVLRDKISKYYYVPADAELPVGVEIEGTVGTGQTVVWQLGEIYGYLAEDEPTIKIPLVLKEEYRTVSTTTYYPTNEDHPEPDLTDAQNGPDGPDTGAKLYYKDSDGNWRYDTIGTPKLPVPPKEEPTTSSTSSSTATTASSSETQPSTTAETTTTTSKTEVTKKSEDKNLPSTNENNSSILLIALGTTLIALAGVCLRKV